jgi:hypothetical protein
VRNGGEGAKSEQKFFIPHGADGSGLVISRDELQARQAAETTGALRLESPSVLEIHHPKTERCRVSIDRPKRNWNEDQKDRDKFNIGAETLTGGEIAKAVMDEGSDETQGFLLMLAGGQ